MAALYLRAIFMTVDLCLKDPGHVAGLVAARGKQSVTDFFRAEAERGGGADPGLLARRLTLVYDGAAARAGIKAEVLDGLAVTTAALLLDSAGVSDEDAPGDAVSGEGAAGS
jgi:hypothetical protein